MQCAIKISNYVQVSLAILRLEFRTNRHRTCATTISIRPANVLIVSPLCQMMLALTTIVKVVIYHSTIMTLFVGSMIALMIILQLHRLRLKTVGHDI